MMGQLLSKPFLLKPTEQADEQYYKNHYDDPMVDPQNAWDGDFAKLVIVNMVVRHGK